MLQYILYAILLVQMWPVELMQVFVLSLLGFEGCILTKSTTANACDKACGVGALCTVVDTASLDTNTLFQCSCLNGKTWPNCIGCHACPLCRCSTDDISSDCESFAPDAHACLQETPAIFCGGINLVRVPCLGNNTAITTLFAAMLIFMNRS